MKKRICYMGIALTAMIFTIAGCGKEEQYQKEITDAWTKTNGYESARYSYKNSYTNADSVSAANAIEGAYNKAEETWSQISAYGTQGTGKVEEVFSPDGVYIRYDLEGEGWDEWGSLDTELPEYASYLTTLFEQEISFENFASIEKEAEEDGSVYTLTYEESYMKQQVKDDLEAAENYLEVLKTSSASQEEVKMLETKIENLEKMAGAQGQVIYYTDDQGNLTGMGSKMIMEDGSGTSAMLRLWDLGEVSFADYI